MYVVQVRKIEASPRGGASVAEDLKWESQSVSLVHVGVRVGNVLTFGDDDCVSNGASGCVVEEGEGPYAWHVLFEGHGVESSRWCFGGVIILLVHLVHTVVDNKLDQLFEKLYVGPYGFKWVAFLLGRAVVSCLFDVSAVVFI